MEKSFPTTPADNLNTSSVMVNRAQNQNELSVRLPKIPLPTFSGKYTDWPSFYDSFCRLVHTNNKLVDIGKFHHLKQALPPNFDSDIRDIPLTDANYSIAYQLLVKRYNNKRVLFSHYMNMLSNQPNLNHLYLKPTCSQIARQTTSLTVTLLLKRNALPNHSMPRLTPITITIPNRLGVHYVLYT